MLADINLSIAYLSEGNLVDDVVCEMLDHQGICYDKLSEFQTQVETYPVVLRQKGSGFSESFARKICHSNEGIIEVDSIVNLLSILDSLMGRDERKKDRFEELWVNQEETKLNASLEQAFSNQNLPFPRKTFWPNNAKAAAVFTHDIDWLSYSPLHKVVFQGRLGLGEISKLLFSHFFKKTNYGWNIPQLVEFEKKCQIASTFFFQISYGRDDSKAARSFSMVKQAGSEIGLHGYHGAHKSANALQSEINSLETTVASKIVGNRYHVLKFRTPESWEIESECGMKYDATFYYNEFFGSRSNICFPYHPFSEKSRFSITELPTSFMDWTALNRRIRGPELFSKIEEIRKEIEKFNGLFVLNFHNTYLNQHTFPDLLEAFQSAVRKVREENYWIGTAKECVQWWNQRASEKPHPRWNETDKVISSESDFLLSVRYKHENIKVNRAQTVSSR